MYENNIVEQTTKRLEKENYIANMLVRTLYSNNVNTSECYRIIKSFQKKVLGNTDAFDEEQTINSKEDIVDAIIQIFSNNKTKITEAKDILCEVSEYLNQQTVKSYL